MTKGTKTLRHHFCEVDDNLYKIVETDAAYEVFVLQDDGSLKAINPGRILAEGKPISKEEFLSEQTAMQQKASKRPYDELSKPVTS